MVSDRIPPGQHPRRQSPVLTAGATPRIEAAHWTFTLKVGPRPVEAWSWSEFNAFPRTKMSRDIPCVTSWSKLSTVWEGVTVVDILADAGLTGDLIEMDIELLRQLLNSTAPGARDGRSARRARHHHSPPPF
ncbi:molybdopterin-dependent oxidoreductase [Bradyrhizobium sp. 1050_B9_N1_2]|uniref:molybdopterin-dependent oxidoreductase n=1 Tax=Bradyrhizobium sp. 1050_B9_N1_2 TaxID=3238688 RepID=UPI003F54E94F